MVSDKTLNVFATCPASHGAAGTCYVDQVIDIARWSDQAGCRGILIYADNAQVDPWLLAQLIVEGTKQLCPLVAVQPIYAHPYTVAKLVASLGYLHGRRTYLNMVAGGFRNDLAALNDTTPHDRRYDRLVEYTRLVLDLLSGAVVSRRGEFYSVDKLKLMPASSPALMPGVFISGSSEAGLSAARVLGATAIKYPHPASEEQDVAVDDTVSAGIRVGIVTREDPGEAWAVAHARFPEDRKGQLTHQLAMKVSDSTWHRELSRRQETSTASDNPYWLVPFENYKTMCPYLVGSYDTVAAELERYITLGYRTFILDVPPSAEELDHTKVAFERALHAVTP